MKNLSGISDNKDIITKEYLDSALLDKVNRQVTNEGVTTTINNNGTSINLAVTNGSIIKQIVVEESGVKLNVYNYNTSARNTLTVGPTVTEITNIVTPTNDTDAANKKYVDDSIGAISIPTKTSDLTNDSGFVTTDEKLKIAAITSGTTYYPIVATNSTGAAARQYDSDGFEYYGVSGVSGEFNTGQSRLTLGNNKTSGTSKWKQGVLRLYGTTNYYVDLKSADGKPTANRTITLPDATGTLALTSDIPDISGKQDTLVSGTNIKTINNQSLLGSGNISISSGGGTITGVTTTAGAHTAIDVSSGEAEFNVPTNTTHLGTSFPNNEMDFPNIGDTYDSTNYTIQQALNILVDEIDSGVGTAINVANGKVGDVSLDGTSVVVNGVARLNSAEITATHDNNGNVTLSISGIAAASGVSF